MVDLGEGLRAVRTGRKSTRTESKRAKTGSSNPLSEEKMTLGSDFLLINFNEALNKESPHYKETGYGIHIEVEKCFPSEEDLGQLMIRYGPTLQFFRIGPTLRESNYIGTDHSHSVSTRVQWSALGSFLIALGGRVANLLGLRDYSLQHGLRTYSHPQVELADFSPGEKYLVTYNRSKKGIPIPSALQIFHVTTGLHMMGAYDAGVAEVSWPVIRWAGGKDDRYFATLGKNTISVYETETFNLLGKKPMEFEDVVDMSWSPTEPIFALLKGCGKQQPAKVIFVEIPGMVEKHKELPDVSIADCNMYWQSNGEYLAVKFDRVVFILSCIKERYINMEVLEVDKKIHAFAWEPSGHRFAMIIQGSRSKPKVSFYSMQSPENHGKVSQLDSFKGEVDTLLWSPRGNYIVLAGLKGSFNGNLEFFNVDNLESMKMDEHPKANVVAWDPSGRYVATAYTISHEMEKGFKNLFTGMPFDLSPRPANGFYVWSFNGQKLYWQPTGNDYPLLQLNWRPYGGTIDEEVLKNLEIIDEKFLKKDLENLPVESENTASEEEYEVKYLTRQAKKNLESRKNKSHPRRDKELRLD